MAFDERIMELPIEAIEVHSTNMKPHEQRLAMTIATNTGLPPIAASDAHRLQDVGIYATDFDDPLQTSADLFEALRQGRFSPADPPARKMDGQ